MHQFPSDESMKRSWVSALHRADFVPTSSSKVCSLHFTTDDYVPGRRNILKADAVPSIFPTFPVHLQGQRSRRRSGRSSSSSRLEAENEDLRLSIESFEDADCVSSLQDLRNKFVSSPPSSPFMLSSEDTSDKLTFVKFASDLPPKVEKSVVVFPDLSFVAYSEDLQIPSHIFENCMQFSTEVIRYNDFVNLLTYVNNYNSKISALEKASDILKAYAEDIEVDLSHAMKQKVLFLSEQLKLLCHPPGAHQRYSPGLVTLAVLWKAHSTSCYKAILAENVLTLPSLRTLRRVSQNFSHVESDTLKYLKIRVEKLNFYERTVILLFDEIYVYQNIEYDNGKFVGLSTYDGLPATTILCFMVKSLSSKYSDVIATVPLRGLNVANLRDNLLKVLKLVMDCGFNVVALCSDNHVVNRSFYKTLSDDINVPCKNPFDEEKDLYLLIDPTHTFKNLYNNFQKRANFQFPLGLHVKSANFNDVKQLYDFESDMSVRMAHKLNQTVMNPTNIQRASAKMTFSLFCDSTAAAFKYYSAHGHSEWMQTSIFISYMTNFVKLCNIRSKDVGVRTRDVLKLPFSSIVKMIV